MRRYTVLAALLSGYDYLADPFMLDEMELCSLRRMHSGYGGRLPLVSITRLRVRSWRYLPVFFFAAWRSAFQARRAQDNLAVTILREAHNTFWTRSLWANEAAMKSFMVSGVHRKVMPRLLNWCDEASVARWNQDLTQEPPWDEVHLRMQRDGRVSRVNHPSEGHRRFHIPALEMKRSKELRFR